MYKPLVSTLSLALILSLAGCGGGTASGSDQSTIQVTSTTTQSKISVNHTPIATFDSFTIQKGARYDGQLTATDADGDTLKYIIVNAPKHGTVVLHDNGCFTYTPNEGYQGSDTFSYRASDDMSSCAVKTVTVDVCKPTIQKPNAPTDLSVKALSTTSLELTWRDNSDNEEEFVIYKDGKPFHISKANKTKAILKCGLEAGTTYNFEVRAKNQAGTSDPASAQGTTKDVTTPPTAPSDLIAKAVEKTSVRLEWKDNSDNESSFEIYQDGVKVKTISSGCSCTVITGLTEGTTYSFVVKAVNKIGSGSSEELTVTTKSDAVAPLAPSDLKATSVTATSLTLTWKDNANNEDRFEIYKDGALVKTVLANTTSAQIDGLAAGSLHKFL